MGNGWIYGSDKAECSEEQNEEGEIQAQFEKA